MEAKKNKDNSATENYHQSQVDGEDQIVLVDQSITAETDEQDPTFQRQDLPLDPEEEDEEEEEDNDDGTPDKEDLEEDDYDLNHDQDDDLGLNIDDDELN